jgi:UDP-glucose 4-epimerase
VCLADVPVQVEPRRAGDPPELVADATALKTDLGWEPKFPTIEKMIQDAFRWHRDHENGYPGG